MTAKHRPDLVIRPFAENDVEAVARLCRDLGAGAEPDDISKRIGGILADSGHQVLIAESPEGGVVGWVHVFGAPRVQSEPFAELGGLAVTASERRKGIGRQLVESAESWAHSNGFRTLRVRSRVERSPAHEFFQSLGFDRVKSQHAFERTRSRDHS